MRINSLCEDTRIHAFTLVELIVVVSIIGIVSAIAVPNYIAMQARSRKEEAKLHLTGLYSAEQVIIVSQGSYTACLKDIGFDPRGSQSYYTVGFNTSTAQIANKCGPKQTATCLNTFPMEQATPCAASSMKSPTIYIAPLAAVGVPYAGVSGDAIDYNSFTAVAIGAVSSADPADAWTINESRVIVNLPPGTISSVVAADDYVVPSATPAPTPVPVGTPGPVPFPDPKAIFNEYLHVPIINE